MAGGECGDYVAIALRPFRGPDAQMKMNQVEANAFASRKTRPQSHAQASQALAYRTSPHYPSVSTPAW
jgi:hypothetical protein